MNNVRAAIGVLVPSGLFLLFVGAWSANEGESSENDRRTNFVFVLADDLRPDCLGALGHSVVETPHLDALVRDGTVFHRAIAAYPICHVSRAEILTGATAFHCGVPFRGNRIDPALRTWAATLREAGFHTWYVGKWHNDGHPTERGYEATRGLFTGGGAPADRIETLIDTRGHEVTGYRGWTFKSDDGRVDIGQGVGLTPDISRHLADAAIEFVQRRPEKPFFLHVNFTAPHDPRLWPPGYENKYDAAKLPLPPSFLPLHPFDHGNLTGRDELLLASPRQPDELRRELAAYYAVISHLDEQVGRLVAALRESGQLDHTVIFFSSDQGLALGSHGLIGKQNMYDHTVGVPLVMRGPGIPKGGRRATPCYLRDLFPTTCDLAGIPIPATVQGKSLIPALRDPSVAVYPFVVGYFTDTQRMIREGNWKLVLYPKAKRTQLFDLAADPGELADLSDRPEHAARAAALRSQLLAWLAEQGDRLK